MGGAAQCVWFKRDLRLADHAPLAEAAARGPVVAVFIAEPAVWSAPDADALHWGFVAAALAELRANLRRRGGRLLVRQGGAVEVLEELRRATGFTALWSHEETGNALTYARDRAVGRWARAVGVVWTERPQNGVVRALRERDGWAARWRARMAAAPAPTPERLGPGPAAALPEGEIPSAAALGAPSACARADVQAGGEAAGRALLASWLDGRGRDYPKQLSSPLTAGHACSRLSPHLAWGTLAPRTAVQAVWRAQAAGGGPVPAGALRALESRLRWRCHFMQKLESEPAVEDRNFSRAADGLREADWDPARHAAWAEGRTGHPFVDACMRSLRATGWLNFRMRAMLVSYAAYDLWLDWRGLRDGLARHFLDYEPGIHVCQLQMQSGTTGINATRIYDPVKQGLDHDPAGDFTARWVPELAGLPAAWRHRPWLAPEALLRAAGLTLGGPGTEAGGVPGAWRYPRPLVDHAEAVRRARARLAPARRGELARAEAARVFEAHGSRGGDPVRRLAGRDRAAFERRRTAEQRAAQPELF